MPFRHNATRRHRIPKQRWRVTNWPAYEAGLRRRGDLTFWLDEAALSGWQAPRRSTPGGQPRYSDLAIELVLTLRLVFHLALRQTEAFSRSVLALHGLELTIPDHTTLSRRGRAFAGRQSRVLHIAVGADTSEIAAHALTQGNADDAAQAPGLLGQAEGSVATVTADGAYDGDAVYRAAATRQHGLSPDAVVPPRASAVLSTDDPAAQTPRDRQIQLIAKQGRMAWQQASGYGRRSLVETAIGRHKHLIGPKLRARTLSGQQGEAALAAATLNRMIRTAKPASVRRT